MRHRGRSRISRPNDLVGDSTSEGMANFIHIDDYDPAAFVGFDGSQVVVTHRLVLFWKPPGPFGQWTPSPFEIRGVTYNCAEQYMMAEKARLFEDTLTEARIMASGRPREQRKLGRRVAGFVAEQWEAERCRIVFEGNVAKFTQDLELKEALLATGERTLVEASPMDRIWGIGFAANAEEAHDPKQWNGLNLLGEVLMEVRDHVAAGGL